MINYKLITYNHDSDEIIKQLCLKFSCGNIVIDNFLKTYKALDITISKTYLFISCGDNDRIIDLIGFFSLSTDSMLEKADNSPVGKVFNGSAIRIMMFAIDKKYQQSKMNLAFNNRTFASTMLLYCIKVIRSIVNNHLGASYIVLNSTKEGFNLYSHTGKFEILDEDYAMPIHKEDGEECIMMYKPVFDIC